MLSHENQKIVKQAIAGLKPHPKQEVFYSKATAQQLKDLAADLAKNGQIHPIEILPDGTIIAGHTRVAAAALLGWTEVAAWVREDLAGDEAAVERRLIDDNLNRRQLGPLALARAYRGLKHLEKNRFSPRLTDEETRELRDRIGERLNCSGRTLDRYLRVLDHTPIEVQNAVECGALPLTIAEKIAGLSVAQKEHVSKEIREGGDVSCVVRACLKSAPPRVKNANDVFSHFSQALARAVNGLTGRLGEVRWITDEHLKALGQGQELIRQLRSHAKKLASQRSSRSS